IGVEQRSVRADDPGLAGVAAGDPVEGLGRRQRIPRRVAVGVDVHHQARRADEPARSAAPRAAAAGAGTGLLACSDCQSDAETDNDCFHKSSWAGTSRADATPPIEVPYNAVSRLDQK